MRAVMKDKRPSPEEIKAKLGVLKAASPAMQSRQHAC
jgi:hypothetical protein